MKCPACTLEIDEERLSCPSCGAIVEDSDAKTRLLPKDSKPRSGRTSSPSRKSSAGSSRLSSIHSTSDSLDHARFVAGTILNERYRIIGLLDRGGMGEVYRAEDLTLEQPVALKFLPETVTADGASLARFHREVRIARQISHRNVCRVYDIGETEGLHFLSMEYVRGEELSSVLKRFGRLPADKASEIARQICAGLAAAHEAGVLHRDLKPSNVMIDENGDVRITDFGLSGLLEEFGEGAALEGTPEYMSPEQFSGSELTARSDIYSLGLVLYEIFTGRKAFSAGTLTDLLRLRKSVSMPESPSLIVKDVDPLVERVIERCLAVEPKERPASALQVAAALPGGDPLAAALAAGETPSPEMVAAAPKQGSLRPARAVALLLAALLALALCVALSGQVYLHALVPMDKSAQGLKERAGEIAGKFGYREATDYTVGFTPNFEYLKYVQENDRSPARWEHLKTGHPSGLYFWYRQSPRYLEPLNREIVGQFDPPQTIAGMAGMSLDTRGHLLSFYGVPPQVVESPAGSAPAFDWSQLFEEAGLDPSTFKQVEPKWVSPHPFDAQAAWEGFYPGQPETPIRVEAASFRGKPVFFTLVNPWARAGRQEQPPLAAGEVIGQALIIVLFFVTLVGAALLARHNLRLGRANRKGAFRLAAFIFSVTMCIWVLGTHHVPSLIGEFNTFMETLAFSLMVGALLWLVYVALEPFLRRRWPARTIAWNRLLAGDWRDPLIGRDLLLGAVFGCGLVLLGYLDSLLPRWLGLAPPTPAAVYTGALRGFQYVTLAFVEQTLNSLIFPSVLMFLLLLVSMVTRREWIAVVLFWLCLTMLSGLSGEHLPVDVVVGGISAALLLFVLLRFGMLASLFTQFFILFFNFYPITSDLNAWYSGATVFVVALSVGLIFFGFRTSLAGQRLFSGSLVGD